MFNIYGGGTTFTQWVQGYKLIMNELPIGADVQFFQDPSEDDPIITEVYEITDESGDAVRVCDVPNILTTTTRRVKAYVDAKVYGAFGVAYNVIGNREKYFEIEAAEKPADYVYVETPIKGCGCEGHEVTDDRIQEAVNKYMEENGATVGTNFYLDFVD